MKGSPAIHTLLCLIFLLEGIQNTLASKIEISDIVDLKGKEYTLKENDTLIFNGGKLINGNIVFNNTKLINPNFENCRFSGSVIDSYFNVREFGVSLQKNTDCSVVLNDIIKLRTYPSSNNNPKTLYFPKGTYYIDSPIEVFAGYEAPVTLIGEGNMSNICQRKNNQYILKVFEQNQIKNLRLSYQHKQPIEYSRSIAIACQRSTFSTFENLTICKAHTGFGYITLSDQKSGYNPTGLADQCYVSDNFKNIRIYDFAGYAFDFKKEFPQGDSGSAFDNIYISSSQWLGEGTNQKSQGAIRGDNTIASFTQLNIEGSSYTSPLIDLGGFSRICIQSLHIEGLRTIPTVANVRIQSVLQTEVIDVQRCNFLRANYDMFMVTDNGVIDICGLCIRPDCKKNSMTAINIVGHNNISITKIIDGANILGN